MDFELKMKEGSVKTATGEVDDNENSEGDKEVQ